MKNIFKVNLSKKTKAVVILFLLLCLGFLYNTKHKTSAKTSETVPVSEENPLTIFVKPGLFGKTPEEKREYLLNNFEMDNVVGNLDAKITVIEYSSFTCKYCKSLRKEINKLVGDYALKEQKIRYILRPLYNTKTIPLGAFIQCARTEDKEKIADYFFSKDIDNIDNMEKFLLEAGNKFNMNEDYVKDCIYDEDMYKKLIYMQQETNTAFNIEGTPVLFINGKEYAGYRTVEKLKTIIDSIYDKTI